MTVFYIAILVVLLVASIAILIDKTMDWAVEREWPFGLWLAVFMGGPILVVLFILGITGVTP